MLDLLERWGRIGDLNGDADALERAALGPSAPAMVAEAVERDRVEPGFLAPLAAVEPAAATQGPLEGVREQVLCEHSVAGAVDEKAEKCLGVVLVEAVELLVAHHCLIRSTDGVPCRRSGIGALDRITGREH